MNQQTQHDEPWHMPLAQFRDALAQKPMPGCGAAASVVADFGLALMLKGVYLGPADAQGAALIKRGETLKQALAPLAGKDMVAFEAMMAALQKPDDTEEQRRSRQAALHKAARGAVEVPLETARLCLSALALGEEIAAHIEAQFKSDAVAGAYLLSAAVQSVLLNVAANVDALGDEDEKRRILKERDTIKIELGAARKAMALES